VIFSHVLYQLSYLATGGGLESQTNTGVYHDPRPALRPTASGSG